MSELLTLTVGGWFSRGWATFKRSPKPIIGGTVIIAIYGLIINVINITIKDFGIWITLPINLVIGLVLTVGWLFLCLRIVRGENVNSFNVFDGFSHFGRVWVTYILFTLIIVGGLILLVIPGIIWALKYSQSLYAVMDKKLSAREAIRFSGKITKGYKGKLFIAVLIAILLSLLAWPFSFGLQRLGSNYGLILLAVGIVPYLLTILIISPWISATFAAAYDSLASKYESISTDKNQQA
jgi:uncharacterized membrane protein